MSKIVGILLVLSFVGLHQTDAFAQGSGNQLEQFIAKRENISSGKLTYRFRNKPYNESDTETHLVTVRFFDVKLGPYYYTALIAEDTFGNILIYDIKNTYKFATHLKRRQISPHKDFNHEEQYFYEPFARYNTAFYTLTSDSNSHLTISDSIFHESKYQIIESSTGYTHHRYIFDTKTTVPIFHQPNRRFMGDDNYSDYSLLDYALNIYDSASFFKMLADSIERLLATNPLPVPERTSIYRMNPLRDTVAPDFTYASLAGDSVQLSKVIEKNKVVIVDFWFAACRPCREAMPALVSLYEKYKPHGLEILSLDPYDKKRAVLDSVIAQHGITYPVLFANQTAVRKYRINGYPCLFVINNGNIVYTYDRHSSNMEATLSEVLEKYLAEGKN